MHSSCNSEFKSSVSDVIPVGMAIVRGLRVIHANPAMLRMLGYCEDHFSVITGRRLWGLVYPPHRARFKRHVQCARSGNDQCGICNYKIMRNDGSYCWMRVTIEPECDSRSGSLRMFFVDISESMEMSARFELFSDVQRILNTFGWDKAVDEVLGRIRSFAGVGAGALCITDGKDFPVKSSFGFPPEFLKDKSCLYCDNGGDVSSGHGGRRKLQCMCGAVLEGRTTPSLSFFTSGGSFIIGSSEEFPAFLPDANTSGGVPNCVAAGYESVAIIPLLSGGETVGFLQLCDGRKNLFVRERIGFIENICSLLGMAFGRYRSEERLRQAQKMEAIGQLTSGVAHDFNNMLSAITGYADIMLNEYVEDERLQRYAERIMRAGKRSSGLIAQLLRFGRKGETCKSSIDVNETVREVVMLLERSIDKRVFVEAQCDAKYSIIHGDSGLILNALLNIGLNARDAMPGGGELLFRTSMVSGDEIKCDGVIGDGSADTCLLITVSDTGCGMDEETQRSIFDPFFTTKKAGEGTGMGLATAHEIFAEHKGCINVSSRVGEGSTFSIYLPLSQKTLAAVEEAKPVQHGAARIMVVDDEDLVRDMAQDMLCSLGYCVKLCNGGAEALAYFREHHAEVDLVLLDMVMPELGGLDTFMGMREIDENVKVILVSGYSLNDEVERMLKMGALEFVPKPFVLSDLSCAISSVLKD